MNKTLIVSIKSWGKRGNALAAKGIKRMIHNSSKTSMCDIIFIDEFIPKFKEVGADISVISDLNISPAQKENKYCQLINSFEKEHFSKEFEIGEYNSSLIEGISELNEQILKYSPNTLIGTKGIISRILFYLFKNSSIDVQNFITNHGLWALPIHQATKIERHFVQFPYSKNSLIEDYGVSGSKIIVTGKLFEFDNQEKPGDNSPSFVDKETTLPIVISLENRNKSLMKDLLRAFESDSIRHKFNLINLILDDNSINDEKSSTQTIHNLSQNDFNLLLKKASDSLALFLSKSGPNSFIEAVCNRVIPIVFYSGLPMERWVIDTVIKYDLGFVISNQQDLVDILEKTSFQEMELKKNNVIQFQNNRINALE